ncbi:butyrophilin-like protein 8 [Trichosurus vulpecula]|uniref:butyrophilin-like protein 8 n=1 Tax=Trichosurus vulpecula TaxID=9337 RepID=UPI00186AC4A5|nr:butyrophilin-like protein 8 [Trichosurus vulpecula]
MNIDMLSISALLWHIQSCKPFEYHLLFIIVLSLIDLGSGQFQVIGPDDPIKAPVGEDVIFSCHILPKINIKEMEVSFFRNQLSSVLLLIKNGKEMPKKQMQEYRGRTQLVQVAIAEGRISIKLKNTSISDSGVYGCQFTSQSFDQKHTWELQVAALGLSPLISLERHRDRGILLICRSAGWFPKPEVQWKNHQGKSLSSDFKVNTGNDGLFDIETSLIIQEPPTGDISCSICIWGLRQESRVKVADQFFQPSAWRYAFIIMMTIFLILVASGLFLHRHQGKLKEELVEVTLDPETAHSVLQVSLDCKKVTYEDTMVLHASNTEKRFQSPSVVALQGFSLGEFYWEVEVGEKNRWFLGVCWDEVDRVKKDPELFPANGYWVLGRWNQKEHFTFSPARQTLTLQVQPKRVGIFLNCKYKQVSFYNVTDKSHIYTFTNCDFDRKILRPFFRPRSNDTNENVPPLIICTKLHKP